VMLGFMRWLESGVSSIVGIEEIKGPYFNPDRIYFYGLSRDKRPFIYLGKDVVSGGKLHISSNSNMTHRELIGRKEELKSRMHDLGHNSSYGYRVEGLEYDLMGRMGRWEIPNPSTDWDNLPVVPLNIPIFLVSFWNPESLVYSRNLIDCLRSMESFFVSGKEVFVSTPLLGTVHISKVMSGGSVGGTLSDEEKDILDLRQRLHLMHPNEKKWAMEKLGVGGGRVSKRGEWEAGMRKLGLPGYIRQSEWSDL